MRKKTVSQIILSVLLIGTLTLAPPNQLTPAKLETLLYIDPSETNVSVGNTFTIDVSLTDVIDLYGYDIWLSYNTSFLDVISVGPPHLLPEPMIEIIEPDGIIHIYKFLFPPEPSFSGSGTLASITFNATALGSGVLDLFDTMLFDPYGSLIPHTVMDGSVTILPLIHGRWAVIEDVNGDCLEVETASDEIWSMLVQLYHNGSERWVGGIVEKYDNEWGFRFNPKTIIVAEVTIEVWQTTIRGISENLDYWLGNMACVGAKVVAINPIRVPEDHPTIQEAINRAVDGGTILVSAGTYYEHVVVNKTVSLVGENRDTTIIDGNGTFVTIVHVTASNVSIRGFTIQNDARIHCLVGGGIYITNSNGSNVFDNMITNTQYPINLEQSTENTITGNLITKNDVAIQFLDQHSSNNTIYHNSFINNDLQVSNFGASNIWDNGCEGNYWSEYTGADADGDGIGDTPYEIDENNKDNYPLMSPYIAGDINHDGTVDIYDLATVGKAYGSQPGDFNWNCHCDITGPVECPERSGFYPPDGVVDTYDLATVGKSYGNTAGS